MRALRLLVAAALALSAAPVSASDFGSAALGTGGSLFLLLDTSARGVAMGGAMTAATNDSSSIYWNPAGLSQVPRLSTSFMFADYVAGITYQAASYAQRVNDTSVFGAGVRYLDGGSVPQTNISGIGEGTFTPYSYVAELGWGQSIYDLSDSGMDLSMGVTARAIHTSLGTNSATGFGGDWGIQSRFYATSMTYDIGLAIQNLGSGEKFDQVRDSMPARVRFGGAVKLVPPLTLSLEGIAPINNVPAAAFGVEYALQIERGIKASARAGLNSQNYDSLGLASIVSFGVGLALSNFSFDYAFVPEGVLGVAAHRLSLSYNLPAKLSSRYRDR
ncbi:MAG: PorV/PorQ family protein [Elusimicrobiota bacterium]